jgi:GTPase involved in cell partitioning and DNA repair
MDYGSNLEDKVEIVVVNKIDLQEVKENLDKLKKAFKSQKIEVLGISALSGEGSDALLSKITQEIEKIPEKPVFSVKTPTKVYTISDLPNKRMVFRGSVTEVVEKDLR